MIKGVKKQVFKKQDSLEMPSKDVISEDNHNNINDYSNYSNKNNKDSNNSDNNPLSIKFTNQNLVEAVIYSEILGKPKCKRRGRCR